MSGVAGKRNSISLEKLGVSGSPDVVDESSRVDPGEGDGLMMEHSTLKAGVRPESPFGERAQTLGRKGRNRSSGRLFKAGTIADIRARVEHTKELVQTDTHYKIHAITILLIFLLGGLLIFVSTKLLLLYLANREPVCFTSECLSTSARVLQNFNSSLNPCDDFYRFACDGWSRRHELPPSVAHYGVEEEVRDRIYDDLRRYLDQVLMSGHTADAHLKAKKFYSSCMNLNDIDTEIDTFFRREIQSVGGWSILGDWSAMNWDKTRTLERLQTDFGVDVYFKIEVGADDLDPQLPYIIKLSPSGLGLPSRDYYFDPRYAEVVKGYKTFMSETVKIFGAKTFRASQFAESTFNYEKRIAEVTPSQEEFQQRSQIYKRRHSIRELRVLAPSVKWENLLQKFFSKARLSDNTRVLLAFEPYFRNISNIISTTDQQGLNDYMIWRMIMHYAPYLSKEFRIVYKNFQNALQGLPPTNFLDDEYRWKFCIDATGRYLGFALSSLYISNRISELSNATVTANSDIVNSIRENILRNKQIFLWNHNARDHESEPNRLIQMKLKTMNVFVGMPQFVLQKNVGEYYNEFYPTTGQFFQNIIEAVNHRHKKMEQLLNGIKKVDFSWTINPHSVRAHYDYAGNSLYIPFGLLQLPFYSSAELRVMQFGGFGFHLAAELLKTFDLIGAFYGFPDGRLGSKQYFERDTELKSSLLCLNRRLTDYDSTLELNRTLSQTYIDDGALRLAYMAYRDLVWRRSEDTQTLPSVKFSSDQLFYLSFAQSMCANTRREGLNYLVSTDSRLPPAQRVNFLLSQNEHFRETFQCPKPKTVSGRRQCHLWRF